MKTQTLFRLGAIAAVITAVGDAVGNLIYLSGGNHTLFFAWFFIVITMIHVFAVIALFAAQADRSEIFSFVGFVLLVIGLLFDLIESDGRLAIGLGVLNLKQAAQIQLISSFILLESIKSLGFLLGAIVFGYGIFRAGYYPRMAGILLLLVGVTYLISNLLGFDLVFYLYAVLSTVTWGWLGLFLWKNVGTPKPVLEKIQLSNLELRKE